MLRAVCYARSSKDRSDVSIDAQLRQLRELAAEKGMAVVDEFTDAVERADDRDRPGLRKLLGQLQSRDRQWTVVLILDTARLARQDQTFANLFDDECKKRGVTVLYKVLPEGNPIMDLVSRQMIRAFDMLHSLMSKEKGLAGMAENVRRGFRAGGRAPLGYTLAIIETGSIRDGAAVTKSRLQPSAEAPKVGAFLRDRATGMPRAQAARRAGLEVAVTSLIGMEWNALTYAGHTVWNVHAERVKGGYKGGRKRRPRTDWVLTRDTHPALISEREAERLLARLEVVSATRARPGKRTYVLAGLVAWQGTPWHGDSGNYRYGKGRKIEAERLERAVLARLGEDLQKPSMVRELTERIKSAYAAEQDPGEGRKLDREIAELTRRIERLGQLLSETTAPQALLRSIEGWEESRAKLQARRDGIAAAAEVARAAKAVREADVRQVLARMAEDLAEATSETLKQVVGRFISAIDLDPVSYACTIKYRLETGDKMASPRGFALIPHFPEVESRLQLTPNRTWRRAA